MNSIQVLGIYREQIFSPGKIKDDEAILDATLAELSNQGCRIAAIKAEDLASDIVPPNLVLSMAQSDRSLKIMETWESSGIRVVNTSVSIRNCYRKPLIHLLQKAGLPLPAGRLVPLAELLAQGMDVAGHYWLKRGDVHAIGPGDVAAVTTKEELDVALEHFRDQGVIDILVQDHVPGRVIKFYGAGQGHFFCAFPADRAEPLPVWPNLLSDLAARAAAAVGLEVYGGDAVLTSQGEVVLIDLNDWPSFSRCCLDAAGGIARYLIRTYPIRS
ncbi:MAG: hypothetical protein HQK57_15775 [Deltaproteobacteria bacterium]|nr:hypothetical protein [Deltaproteobacteria bacterium]